MGKMVFLLGFIFLVSCGIDDGPALEEIPAELRIASFDADQTQVVEGDSVQVSWKVQGYDKATLVQEPEGETKKEIPVTDPFGNLNFALSRSTVFRLVATQGPKKIEAQATVTVVSPQLSEGGDPSIIVDFGASKSCLRAGEATKLTWNVQNADKINIEPATLQIPITWLKGERVVPLLQTTNFKLVAERLSSGASAFKSVLVKVDPVRYTTTFTEKIVQDHNDLAIDPNDPNHFYLATATNVFEWINGTLTNLRVVPQDSFSAVAVNQTDPSIVYAAHREMVRRSRTGGRTWSAVIPVLSLDQPQAIFSLSARGDDLIIAATHGIFHYDTTYSSRPTIDLVHQVSGINKVYASSRGFFAATATDVYASLDGNSWYRVSLPPPARPVFFHESDRRIFAITSNGGAYEWLSFGGGWSSLMTPLGGVVKAVEAVPGLGLIAVVGGKVYLQSERGGDWVETTISGTLPTVIKGQLRSQGKIYLWDGKKVYEWSTALTPLSCTPPAK
ncbi:MAG: hypothetical protein HYS22_08235 [Deltaproteobacteria bacterium]|nr:hypothetical protein [Deltaproteobacteria bacterium]